MPFAIKHVQVLWHVGCRLTPHAVRPATFTSATTITHVPTAVNTVIALYENCFQVLPYLPRLYTCEMRRPRVCLHVCLYKCPKPKDGRYSTDHATYSRKTAVSAQAMQEIGRKPTCFRSQEFDDQGGVPRNFVQRFLWFRDKPC